MNFLSNLIYQKSLLKIPIKVNINPDFYGAVLFHNLMGDSVRNVEVIDNDQAAQNIHLYIDKVFA